MKIEKISIEDWFSSLEPVKMDDFKTFELILAKLHDYSVIFQMDDGRVFKAYLRVLHPSDPDDPTEILFDVYRVIGETKEWVYLT